MVTNPFAQFKKKDEEKNPFTQFTNPNIQRMSALDSFLSGAGDALTFGWGDELQGWGAGLLGMDGNEVTENARRWQARASLDEPGWFFGGQLGGSIAGGLGAGMGARAVGAGINLGSKVGLMGRVATSGLTGAAGGAAYGAGAANEGDRLGGAAEGALLGGAFGAGTRALGAGVGHVYREGVRPAFSAPERAAKHLAEQGQRYGQTPAALAKAAQDAPDNATMMDVQAGGPSLVMGAASRPSAQREAFREMLDERNNAMPDAAAEDLWDSTIGKKLRIDAGRRINELEDEIGKITYDDIDAGPAINLSTTGGNRQLVDFVTHHMNSPDGVFKGAIRETLEEMKVADPSKVGLRAVGDAQWDYHHMSAPKFWRSLLTKVREDAQAARKAAKITGVGKSAARSMMLDYNDLRTQVGKVLGPEWEAKQAAYKALKEEQDYLKFGYETIQKVLNTGGDMHIGKFMARFAKLDEQKKQWVRQGALARVEDTMNAADTQTGRADVLRSIIGTKSKINVLNNILGRATKDGGIDARYGFAKVLKRLEAQRDLFHNSVKSGIGVNSHTADKLLAHEAQLARTNPLGGSSGIMSALWNIISRPKADAFDEEVSNHILSAMSRSPKEFLAEVAAAGGPDEWAKQAGAMARMNGGLLGRQRPSVQALAALRQREAEIFRQKQFQDALYNGPFIAVGGAAVGSDY